MSTFKVYARWRPLPPNEDETQRHEITHEYNTCSNNNEPKTRISITSPSSIAKGSWKSNFSFDTIFHPTDTNHTVSTHLLPPILPTILAGKTANFFAYGHSGSGKTHTMIGYDFTHDTQFGLCLAAARSLSTALEELNTRDATVQFGLGLRIFELRKNIAFDLLNQRNECFVREGGEKKVYIRGETEMLEGGKVRVRPIATVPCWGFEEFLRELIGGLALRETGSSTIHDLSSRTHAVIEIEIVTRELLAARNEIVECQSALVPIGKHATDVYIEEQMRAIIRTEDGGYVPNPEYQVDQDRIDAAEAKKVEFEARVQAAVVKESAVLDATAARHPCIGGKLVFVDLAGAEYFSSGGASAVAERTLSTQERQQGRQINTDLLALKEVIRARALGKSRIPYRSSPLTMVLREHFEAEGDTQSAMILTVSPEASQFASTVNTLKYGDLLALPGANRR
ncbi:P-loop containing nucleoside triphosphate hydrolase protein [Aspergillus karnatakaensis]|uniref:kinesin family protein n=1 Tax=Aspergillus karnatakaensis TaxID=1810916 RepID=UPI003CCCC37A